MELGLAGQRRAQHTNACTQRAALRSGDREDVCAWVNTRQGLIEVRRWLEEG